jgi:hypothetical protein
MSAARLENENESESQKRQGNDRLNNKCRKECKK